MLPSHHQANSTTTSTPQTVLDESTPCDAPDQDAAFSEVVANKLENCAGAPEWMCEVEGIRLLCPHWCGTCTTTTTRALTPSSSTVGKASKCDGQLSSTGSACSCTPTLIDCNKCTVDAHGVPAVCKRCKNSAALESGQCISQQFCESVGGTVSGKGQFGLKCILPDAADGAPTELIQCVGKEDSIGRECWCNAKLASCHACWLGTNNKPETCIKCKDGAVLLKEECVSKVTCVASGGVVQGNGQFNLKCVIA